MPTAPSGPRPGRARRPRTLRLAAAAVACAALAVTAACSSSPTPRASATGPAAAPSPTQPAAPAQPLRDLAAASGLRFGAAIDTDTLASDPAYAALAGEQFSTVTPENVMKWEVVEPTQGRLDFSAADRLVAFAQAHDQLVRGHTLVWYSQLPAWLTKEAPHLSAAQVRAILKAHVQDEVRHFQGTIWQWDVVNEAVADDGSLRDNIWLEALGKGYVADAFRWAHEADPHAKLFYNDYGAESSGAKADAVYDLVKGLVDQGVPIDGVGFQTHLSTRYATPDLQTNLQRFADLGLDVAVTEADVRTTVPATASSVAMQSDLWSSALGACLAVDRCISFTVWGVDDTGSWIPSTFPGEGAGLLFDHLQPKPELDAVRQTFADQVGAPQRVS